MSISEHIDQLTPRELEVWHHVAMGKMNKEIADFFGTSIKTVEKHRDSLYGKMGFTNVVPLVHAAVRYGVITIPASGPRTFSQA